MKKKCPRCGFDFAVKPSHYDKRNYCSKHCYRMLPVSNEYILNLYNLGKSCKEIGKEVGITGKTVLRVVRDSGLDVKSNSFYQISKNESFLTETHGQILDGLLLGDGSVLKRKNSVNSILCVKTVEHDFVNYLMNSLPFTMRVNSIDQREQIFKNKTYQCKKSYSVSSKVDVSLNAYRNKWYVNGVKVVPKDLSLTPLSIKIWFWGDGSTTYRKYKGNDSYVSVVFCTDGFTVDDCRFLIDRLQAAIGVNFSLILSKGYPRLYLNKSDSVSKFFSYIGNCDLSCYNYKWKLPSR